MHLTSTPLRTGTPQRDDLLCQRIIAELAGHTRTPDVHTLLTAVDRHLPGAAENRARADRQNLAGNVNAYFNRLLPPPAWRFTGWEHALTAEHVEVWWQHPTGRVLADEIYTGRGELLASTPIQDRGQSRLTLARLMYGRRLAGVRLIATSKPHLSRFLTPASRPIPLTHTTFVS